MAPASSFRTARRTSSGIRTRRPSFAADRPGAPRSAAGALLGAPGEHHHLRRRVRGARRTARRSVGDARRPALGSTRSDVHHRSRAVSATPPRSPTKTCDRPRERFPAERAIRTCTGFLWRRSSPRVASQGRRPAATSTRFSPERRLSALAPRSLCLHHVSMTNVLVRDIPDEVHAALQRRAEQRGQSLQQYLAGELARLAERPSVDELFARVSRRRGGKVGLEQAARDLADERSGH